MGAFTQRFSITTNGAITFTGNTVGLSKDNNSNDAGTEHSIGAYITNQNSTQVDGYGADPNRDTNGAGSTFTLADNGSFAYLNLPAGSTIEYVDLIWAGSYRVGSENNSALIGNAVTVNVNDGTKRSITPELTYTSGTTVAYYINVAQITSTNWPELMALTGGSYKIECDGVVGTTYVDSNSDNACGWTLCIVYSNATLPSRNMTIYSGNNTTFVASNNTVESTVSGFQTPTTGDVEGRVLFTALEGDAVLTGDSASISNKANVFHNLLGPNNPINNFFCSQINNNAGNVDTTGSFGEYNQDAINGENIVGGRQGWDITNVNANPNPFVNLDNDQTSTTIRCTSSGDRYWVTGVGVQIDVNAPIIKASKMAKPASVVLNDIIKYELIFTNTGTADAENIVITDVIPPNTVYEPNTITVSVPADVTGFPPTIELNSALKPGESVEVNFSVRVTGIPQSNTFINSALMDYTFIGPDAQPIEGQAVTNEVITTISAQLPPFAPRYNIETCKNGTTTGTVVALSVQRNYPISYFLMVPPTNGFAKIDSNTGEWVYTPKYGFVGQDSFRVGFIDSVNIAGSTVVTINVLDLTCTEIECLKCRCKI